MKTLLIAFFACITGSLYAQKIVLATYQYDKNDRLNNIRPLAGYLSDSLHIQVEVKSYPTVHQFIEGIQKNEVDIALINTFGYLLLEAAPQRYQMKPAAVLNVKQGAQDNYKTAFVTRKDVPLHTIGELPKLAGDVRLGLVAIGSTSGNLVPRLKMNALGITSPETAFDTLMYCKNHSNALDMLLNKETDVCAVGSTEYFKRAWEVKLLWLSSEIPLGPVLLHNRLPDALKKQITAYFLQLDRSAPAVLNAVKDGWSEAKYAEKYITIDGSYYDGFKKEFGDAAGMEQILKQFAN